MHACAALATLFMPPLVLTKPCFALLCSTLLLPRAQSVQSNRPLDSKVQEAQRILAKALRRGGKRVLLPGLELRYGNGCG